jgi:hypothetical protein
VLGDSSKLRELIGRLDLLLEQSQQIIAGSVQGQFEAAAFYAPAPPSDEDGDRTSDPEAGAR